MFCCLLGCGTQDEAEDEAEVCVLCCQKRSTVAVCDECKEHYCTECIDTGLLLLICWATLYGFAPWPPEHQQMF